MPSNELTWIEVKTIINIADGLCNELGSAKIVNMGQKAYYQEVLRRFNEAKRKEK